MLHPEMPWEKAVSKVINQKPGMAAHEIRSAVKRYIFLGYRSEFGRWFNEEESKKYLSVMDDRGEIYYYPKETKGFVFAFHENDTDFYCKPEHKDSILYQLSLEK